jgi:hypothetical protein
MFSMLPPAPLDHAAPGGEGDVEGAVEHRLDDGVEAAGGEVLGGREEVAGGVVHHHVDAAPPVPHGGDHRLHLGEVAHVAGVGVHPVRVARDLPGGACQPILAAAGDGDPRPQRGELLRHGESQPGAAARDQHRLPRQQIVAEHRSLPSIP